MGLSMQVHHFRKEKDPRNPAASIVKLVRSEPYARFSLNGDYVFVQNGKAYYADGVALSELPDWLVAQMLALTPGAAKECGADKVLTAANISHDMNKREIKPVGLTAQAESKPVGMPTDSDIG